MSEELIKVQTLRKFNRNILYCKSEIKIDMTNYNDNLIETFCIVNYVGWQYTKIVRFI